MSAFGSNLFYGLRWGLYLIRWVLFAAYGLLQFVSKPGSRLIVPVLAAAVAFYCRLPLDAAIDRYVLEVDWRHMPEPATLYMIAALGLVLAACVFAALAPHLQGETTVSRGVLVFAVRLAVVAALVVAGAYYFGLPPEWNLESYLPELDWQLRHMPVTAADAVLVLAFLLATCVYVALSRLLTLLLGAFPPIVRPLRPMRGLSVKNRPVRPVVVRQAVPKLPRRSRTLRVETLPGAVK